MTGRPRPGPSRRELLAAAGAASVLSGCAGLSPFSSPPEPTYVDADALAAVTEPASPSVPRTVPVPIDGSHRERAETLARDRLSTVPDPLGPQELPNGAIREEITRAVEASRTNLERAADAPSPFETLRYLRWARGTATDAAAAWRAVEGALTRSDVAARATEVRARLDAVREGIEYVGDRVVPAVVVLDAVETLAASAEQDLAALDERIPAGPVGAPIVGQMAHYVASARAATDDAAHLYDQHRSETGSSRSLRGRLDRAAAALTSTVEERLEPIPGDPEPSDLAAADVSDTPAEWLLRLAGWAVGGAGRRIRELRRDGRDAGVVLAAHRTLASLRALERVRERVESGERFRVESARTVRTRRAAAIDALRSVAGTSPATLTRTQTSRVAGHIRSVDEDLAGESDRRLASEVGEDAVGYVWAGAVARAIPGANERAVEALDDRGR